MTGNPREIRKNAYLHDRGWWSHAEGLPPSQLFSCERSWEQTSRLLGVSRELIKESERLMAETKKNRSQTVQARAVSMDALAHFWVARGRDS